MEIDKLKIEYEVKLVEMWVFYEVELMLKKNF